ncbi:MAG: hypothetical protein H6881_08355 [Rhodobiaceae bacterium]|nr:hypothetical protein [Rhodobiaceae bacterium]MCC0051875.1 hypothetical protein [Rhodobiaceae bacterium]
MKLPKEIEDILATAEPAIRKAFIEAIERIRSHAQMRLIIAALEEKNIEAAINILRIDPAIFHALDRAISDAYFRGGVAALAKLPKIPDPFGVAVRFLLSMEGTSALNNGSENTPEN